MKTKTPKPTRTPKPATGEHEHKGNGAAAAVAPEVEEIVEVTAAELQRIMDARKLKESLSASQRLKPAVATEFTAGEVASFIEEVKKRASLICEVIYFARKQRNDELAYDTFSDAIHEMITSLWRDLETAEDECIKGALVPLHGGRAWTDQQINAMQFEKVEEASDEDDELPQ